MLNEASNPTQKLSQSFLLSVKKITPSKWRIFKNGEGGIRPRTLFSPSLQKVSRSQIFACWRIPRPRLTAQGGSVFEMLQVFGFQPTRATRLAKRVPALAFESHPLSKKNSHKMLLILFLIFSESRTRR